MKIQVSSKKILIVDDHPENVFYLQDRLEKEGYEILTAYEGKTGIHKALTELPDLILLDIMMPEISGLEVCKTLVNNPTTSNIPIILVSAKTEAQDTMDGLQAGALDYIKKPVNRIELLARVNSALKLSETHKKLIELEKINTYTATVVTANHKIKQPLTLMNLTSTAIKRELNKEVISKEGILKKLEYIDNAVQEINNLLDQLNAIKKPIFSEYIKNIQMIDVDAKDKKD